MYVFSKLLIPVVIVMFVFSGVALGEESKSDSVQAVAKGNNQFAFELYKQLKDNPAKNLFFSPISISTALAMTWGGARETTESQMSKVLHFPFGQAQLHLAFSALLNTLDGTPEKDGFQLSVANALWGQKDFGFDAEFIKLCKEYYKGGFSELDFVNDTENARQTINSWTEKNTQDKIKELLKEKIITVDTRMVLTNAIYFKGNWASQFKKSHTSNRNFQMTKSESKNVPTMYQESKYKYHENDNILNS